MKTRTLALAVLFFSCAMLLLGAVSRASEIFTVTFNAPGALYQTPAFGTDTLGTDGIDNLDYGFQLPPFNQLTLRFTNNNYDGTLVKDVRAEGLAKTWVLEVSNLGTGQSFTLSWTKSDTGSFLGDKTLTITPRTSPLSVTDMKAASSVLVNANGLYDIILKQNNSEPVAMPDSAVMFKQSEASKLINVLLNDRDPDAGQTLAIKSVVSPTTQAGTAVIENGQLRYTPAVGFKGQDTFSYTIQDNGSPVLEASSTVTVQVEDVINGTRTHATYAGPGTAFTVSIQAYYGATVAEIRFLEYLPTKGDGSSWAYVANSATVTSGCTVTPQQTGNQLELIVAHTGAALPASPGPISVTYQITVPPDATVGTTKSLTGDLFVNAGNTAISTVPQTSFTIGIPYHSADYGKNWKIDFNELLRIITLYQAGAYHIDAAALPDGFATGAGDTPATGHHSADYGKNWKIDFNELLRVITLYQAGAYHADAAALPDGFGTGQ